MDVQQHDLLFHEDGFEEFQVSEHMIEEMVF